MDLEGDEEVWPRVVEGIRTRQDDAVRVVAFGPHVDVALLDRARKLGCDEVMAKGQFNRDLTRIIQERGSATG